MGGSESGYLAVQVETRNIQAGCDITGVVHFHLETPIRAESLGLKFSGKEYCYWEKRSSSTNSNGSTSTSTTSYVGKTLIVKQLFPIFVFQDSQVAAGYYSFPFQISTPPTLPSSFDYHFSSTKAHIKYLVSAYINSASDKVKKAKTEVGVSRPMTEVIVSLQGAVSAQISTGCCLRQGEVSLGVLINKSAYVPGEMCSLSVEVDNSHSLLDVTRLKGTLFRTLRLKATDGETVEKQTINEGYVAQRIAVGKAVSGPSAIHMALAVQDSKGSVQNATTLKGVNIECVYTVVVRAEMDGYCMCCGDAPEITREVTVYPMQLPAGEKLQAPLDWSPTVMPLAHFSAESWPSPPLPH